MKHDNLIKDYGKTVHKKGRSIRIRIETVEMYKELKADTIIKKEDPLE